jgi:hypothetical protein
MSAAAAALAAMASLAGLLWADGLADGDGAPAGKGLAEQERNMNAVVVFESMYGNTQRIAEAIAEGLGPPGDVRVVEVGEAGAATLDGADLLVAGGPTHAHGLSRAGTRAGAADRTGDRLVSRGAGLREWLAALPRGAAPRHAAAFDTRFDKPRWLTGSAARGTAAGCGASAAGCSFPRRASSWWT